MIFVKGTFIRLGGYRFLRKDGDLVLVCDDFKLTGVAWSHQDDELCPSNVMSAKEFIAVDGMANCDLFQVNPISGSCLLQFF
jgi:hypothetical protein